MRSNRRLTALIIPVALAGTCALAACSDEADSGLPEIAVAAYPMQFIAEQVAGDLAEVTSVAPAGTEPHDLELSPSAVATLTSADVVLTLAQFQAAVDDALTEVSDGTVIVDAADFAHLLESDHDHDHGEEEHGEEDHGGDDHDHGDEDHGDEDHGGDGHDHGGVDPHFWLDPSRVADVADGLAAALGEADPDNADAYTANAAALRTELEAVTSDYEAGLATCEQRTIVTSHEAFGYLAAAFDLEQIGITGIDPEAEPSPARIAEVLEEARAEGVTTIYNEPGGIVAGADAIADELGITLATLNPIELAPTEGDYLTEMAANLTALQEGLVCN